MSKSTNVHEAAAAKLTALVVDDCRFNRKIHSKLLDNLDVENQVAGNGQEAVDVHNSGKQFDLILMDKDMPVMNGIEATRTLRAMGIRSMIVGVSSHHKEEVKEFEEAGLHDYLEKPLTENKLVNILQRLKIASVRLNCMWIDVRKGWCFSCVSM